MLNTHWKKINKLDQGKFRIGEKLFILRQLTQASKKYSREFGLKTVWRVLQLQM